MIFHSSYTTADTLTQTRQDGSSCEAPDIEVLILPWWLFATLLQKRFWEWRKQLSLIHRWTANRNSLTCPSENCFLQGVMPLLLPVCSLSTIPSSMELTDFPGDQWSEQKRNFPVMFFITVRYSEKQANSVLITYTFTYLPFRKQTSLACLPNHHFQLSFLTWILKTWSVDGTHLRRLGGVLSVFVKGEKHH